MPRTKGSKNRITASTDFDAQIAKLQKDKAMLEEGLSKTVAQIEELKTDIKSLRESLKPQKAEIKQTEKEIVKLEAKKATAEAKAAEAAKKVEAEAMLKKLLASGMTEMRFSKSWNKLICRVDWTPEVHTAYFWVRHIVCDGNKSEVKISG